MQTFSARFPDSQIGAYRPIDNPVQTSEYRGVPGIQDADIALTQRLQTLLDEVANISLCRRGNVSATMTSLKDNAGTLETQLYITVNHKNDDSALGCLQHLRNIFNILRRVPYKQRATGGSPNVIADELESNHIDICQTIHDYSFNGFSLSRYQARVPSFGDSGIH